MGYTPKNDDSNDIDSTNTEIEKLYKEQKIFTGLVNSVKDVVKKVKLPGEL